MTEEENLRELDKRLRNQIQNLLESKEGRKPVGGRNPIPKYPAE